MAEQTAKQRVVSLDAARAIVVALMIFMDHPTALHALPSFLVHPAWHGFRLPDLVFPAFVFIAGVSMAFATRKLTAEDFPAASATFARRLGVLFLIGLALNFAKYSLPTLRADGLLAALGSLRIMGVLQRIALGSLAAWPLVRKGPRWALGAATVLLLAHSAVLLFAAAPGVAPGGWVPQVPADRVLAVKQASIAGWIDRTVLGVSHTYQKSGFDPEGLLGVLSTAAQAMLGLALGKLLLRDGTNGREVPGIVAWGAGAAMLGIALSTVVPVNKYLWTPTFVLVGSGLTTLLLVSMYRWIDVGGHKRGFRWLVPMGRNALLLYIGSNLFVVLLRFIQVPKPGGGMTEAFAGAGLWLSQVFPTAVGSLLFSGAEVAMWLVVAKLLYDRKWFFKI